MIDIATLVRPVVRTVQSGAHLHPLGCTVFAIQPVARTLHAHSTVWLREPKSQMTKLCQGIGHIKARAKSTPSDEAKLTERIKKQAAKKVKPDTQTPGHRLNMVSAVESLGDTIGIRLTMPAGFSPSQLDKLVSRLCKAIRNGDLTILELENWHGPKMTPYLTTKHMTAIQRASKIAAYRAKLAGKDYPPMNVKGNKTKASGYTAAHMVVIFKNGAKGEFQVRKSYMDRIADAEHILYNLRNGKAVTDLDFSLLPGNIRQVLETDIRQLQESYQSLTAKQCADYNTYILHQFQRAHCLDNGQYMKEEPLPLSLRNHIDTLDFNHITGIQKRLENAKTFAENTLPFSATA